MIVHGEELLVPAHLNFGKFVLDRLRKAKPGDSCLIDCASGEKLSYAEFTQHAVNVSAALTALGVARGDTVAVAAEPRATYVPTALAVIFTGAAYTPIELDCGRATLAHKLNLTKPKYVICSRLFWEAYSDVLRELEFIKTFICFDDIDDIKLSVATMASRHVDVTTFEPADVAGETDVAMIAYSSGTTGMSKGVMLTHLNCIAGSNRGDSYLTTLRTSYSSNELASSYNILMIFCSLCSGIRVIYSEKLQIKTVQDYQVNIMFTVPGGVEDMLKAEKEEYELSSLKIVCSSGSHLHPSSVKLFKQRYPHTKLLQLYGATEVGGMTVTEILSCAPTECTTAVGTPLPGVALKVVDVKTRETLGPNQRGEICVWSPCLMKGYLGATSSYLDEQGFFLTGDLGYYDDSRQFFLVDRLKDIISYEGYQVAPGEVESVLLGHPAVREAAVVGKPAGPVGELPTAFVVLQSGAQATETELVDYVAKEVSWYMHLRGGVRFLSELPKNSPQKVLRRRLRDMLELEEFDN